VKYTWDFYFVWQYWELFLRGISVSIGFCVVTIVLGLIIGLLCAIGLLSRHRFFTFPIRGYVEAFRCTPLLVQIIWMYYALPVVLNVDIPATIAAGLALTCYISSFYAEIFRGGVVSIEKGQWDAARALGMTRSQLMRRIILPQAIKRMVPSLVNQSVLQFKNTSLLSVIAVGDILYQGSVITAATYRPLEVYSIAAVIYFLILYPSTILAQRLEARLAISD
jgi:polar amino acid transport system permease protein